MYHADRGLTNKKLKARSYHTETGVKDQKRQKEQNLNKKRKTNTNEKKFKNYFYPISTI